MLRSWNDSSSQWTPHLLKYYYLGILLSWYTIILGYYYLGILLSWDTIILGYYYLGILLSWDTSILESKDRLMESTYTVIQVLTYDDCSTSKVICREKF